MRETAFEDYIEGLRDRKEKNVTLGGRPATSHFAFSKSGKARVVVMVVKNPQADGRTLVFVAAADKDRWPAYEPIFQKIFNSIRISK